LTRIALLSDTHGYIDDQIVGLCQEADEIWHAGDIGTLAVTDRLAEVAPVRAVYGNIDGTEIRSTWPKDCLFTLEDARVWITHIGGYPNRYHPLVRDEIRQNPPDYFICGHSHILKVIPDKKLKLLHLNPGAIGKQGFHQIRTMLRFKMEAAKIFDLEVVELKR
jgi:putative phosphoesterase